MDNKILPIVVWGDERLKKASEPVNLFDEELQNLIEKMFNTLLAKKGLGLAAVQIGQLWRVFITNLPEDKQRIFINAELLQTSEKKIALEEGCLSIPDFYDQISRPAEITVQAFDQRGKPFKLEAKGLLARVIQHELDHTNGILFIDYLSERKIKSFKAKYKKKVLA